MMECMNQNTPDFLFEKYQGQQTPNTCSVEQNISCLFQWSELKQVDTQIKVLPTWKLSNHFIVN